MLFVSFLLLFDFFFFLNHIYLQEICLYSHILWKTRETLLSIIFRLNDLSGKEVF